MVYGLCFQLLRSEQVSGNADLFWCTYPVLLGKLPNKLP